MSPLSFRQQVTQLVTELTKCIKLCEDIRINRHIGNTHENLDKLQSILREAEVALPARYNSIRDYVGPEFDTGDQRARSEIDRHIHDVQTMIRPRLRNIAHPPQVSEKDRNPGFREIRQQWRTIYDSVNQTMFSLSRRVESASNSDSTANYKPKPKVDDVSIPLKEWNEVIDHYKNSWEEVISGGKLVYVNMYDRSKKQYERPDDAFIKTLPGSRIRAPSWDRRSPRW